MPDRKSPKIKPMYHVLEDPSMRVGAAESAADFTYEDLVKQSKGDTDRKRPHYKGQYREPK